MMDTNMLMSLEAFSPFANGLDHPEAVAWGLDGYVYAGGEAGQIYRVHPETGEYTVFANTGGFILGLAFDGAGNLYACDLGNTCVQKITPEGAVSLYSRGTLQRPLRVPNYPTFAANGNLYVTDSGGHRQKDGCLYVIRPGGMAEVVSTALAAFPNGMAMHPDGRWLYVVLSNLPGVVRVAVHEDGAVGEPEVVVELPYTVPDGLAFDAENNLYVSCYTPDRIYRVTPAGTTDIVVEDWESTRIATPTNIAFGGADMKTLFLASLGRWHLTKADMAVPGSKLFYPLL